MSATVRPRSTGNNTMMRRLEVVKTYRCPECGETSEGATTREAGWRIESPGVDGWAYLVCPECDAHVVGP